ncbi:iron-containing alcohol dehydrogenase [Amycolatopsis jejuensis]|uniref:iron-containing alcohol dehydrogenase n=1 Tax=Amycolatopsis jejuensis TaxID=330084 RepID=UPI00068A4EB8|nr:iron-containing alcohol dehydrogenase [Amycolatopsis jejuensis]
MTTVEPAGAVLPGTDRLFELPQLASLRYGPTALQHLAELVDRAGARRVLVVTNPATVRHTGAVDRIGDILGGRLAGVFAGAAAHVPLAVVAEARAAAKACNADLVLALGGGSAIDCAKAVALTAADPRPVDAVLAEYEVHGGASADGEILPQIAVPTTLSAAEYTATFTVTMPAGGKVMYHSPRITPADIVLDSTLVCHTPAWLWAATGFRAIDHCVEWYLSRAHTPFTDALVRHALPMLWRGLPAVLADPDDPGARLDCQLAAWMSVFGSGNVLGGLSHAIGHQLGSHTGMAHGHTSCVMLPHVLDFNASAAGDRLADLARIVGAADHTAAAFIAALRALRDGLGLPGTIAEATAAPVDIDAISRDVMTEVAIVNNPRTVAVEDVVLLLSRALHG